MTDKDTKILEILIKTLPPLLLLLSQHQTTNLPLMLISHTPLLTRTPSPCSITISIPTVESRLTTSPLGAPQASLLLKIPPPLHGNLTTIEFAFSAMSTLITAFNLPSGLARVAPREVVEMPERVCREYEVPDG